MLYHSCILSQINLVPYEKDRDSRTVVLYLRPPFLFNVVERDGTNDGETSEEDVGLWVGERT